MLSKIARARAGSWATFAALALAAALVDLGAFHHLEQADSIVPVLVSLQRWTPFYWDQERYGMLVPLLALPVRDPLWNLLLQRGLLVLAGLAAVVLLARHVLARRDWRVAGGLAAAALLAAPPAGWRFEYLGDQPYGLSLALALAGLAFAEPIEGGRRGARLAVGLVLAAAAHWVNAAAGLLLLPLALARAAVDRLEGEPAPEVRRRLTVEAALLAAGLAAGQALLHLGPLLSGTRPHQTLGTLPPAEWPAAWAALFGNAWRASGPWPWALAALAGAGLLLLSLPAHRPLRRGALLRAAALCLAALAYALATGTLRWVADNSFHWRYLAPSEVLVHLAAVSLVAEPLARRTGTRAVAAAVALVPLAALSVSGPPSLAQVRADLGAAAGMHALGGRPGEAGVTARRAADVLGAACVLVTGDYWSVWPAVYHAALDAHDRGEPAPAVYGLSFRSSPTAPAWTERPREALRICRVRGEETEAERQLRGFHLWPARVIERRPTVDVLIAEPPPAGGS